MRRCDDIVAVLHRSGAPTTNPAPSPVTYGSTTPRTTYPWRRYCRPTVRTLLHLSGTRLAISNPVPNVEQPHHTWRPSGIGDQFVLLHNKYLRLAGCPNILPQG